MSTFGGKLEEIDYISIDRFTNDNFKSFAYFLSHCHWDHMEGLNTIEFKSHFLGQKNVFLYTSPVSKVIIGNMFPDLKDKTKELDMYDKNFIEIPEIDKILTVTLIPAGHCPGSVMFLFETDKRILYTGDIRIRAKELEKVKSLKDMTGNIKIIHNIYLDTTFFKKSFMTFPRRDDSIKEFCRLVNEWLEKNDKNIISIKTPATYGSEFLFIEVAKNSGMTIHVDKKKYNFCKCIPEMDSIVTLDGTKTRIHNFCNGFPSICSKIDKKYVREIKPSAMTWENENYENGIVKILRKGEIGVAYSSHSSYTEIIDVLKFIKPLNITACVVPEKEYEKKEMYDLIKQVLHELHPKESTKIVENENLFVNKTNWTAPESNNSFSNDSEVKNKNFFNILSSPKSKKRKV